MPLLTSFRSFSFVGVDQCCSTQVLELGAGPGVAGLVAARVARRCYLTDYHNEVLYRSNAST